MRHRKFSNWLISLALTLVLSAVWVSCSTREDPGGACGGLLEYEAEDTLVICIPDSAYVFAGPRDEPNGFNLDAYLFKEFQIARDPALTNASAPYGESFTRWKEQSWDTRRGFLPYPFSRDAVGSSDAEFYFWLSEFPEQFGFGWTDTYLDSVTIGDPTLGNIWYVDNPQTIAFDGRSPLLSRYRDMLIYLER